MNTTNTQPGASPAQGAPSTIYGFDQTGMERVVETVRLVEATFRNAPPQPRQNPNVPLRGPRIAKTGAGGIPAMSGSTPGKAAITLYNFDTNDNLVVAASNPSKPTNGYNLSTTAVGSNAWIQVKFVQGRAVVDWENC